MAYDANMQVVTRQHFAYPPPAGADECNGCGRYRMPGGSSHYRSDCPLKEHPDFNKTGVYHTSVQGVEWHARGENVLPKKRTLAGGIFVPPAYVHAAAPAAAQAAPHNAGRGGQHSYYGSGRGGPVHGGRGAMGYDRQTGQHPYHGRGGGRGSN